MKGYRFYEELENKNRKGEQSKGTVIALYLDSPPFQSQIHDEDGHPLWVQECAVGVFEDADSPCCSSSVALSYLAEDTRRTSEQRAREIHPKLFEYLERGE